MAAVKVSFFDNATSTKPHPVDFATWEDLVEALRTSETTIAHPDPRGELDDDAWKRVKAQLPAWSPAVYPRGKTRGKANVSAVSSLVADLDDVDNAAVEALRGRLRGRGLAYVLHTTPSQVRCPPGVTRARLIIPLTREVPGDEKTWQTTRAALLVFIGVADIADRSASDASRLYFLPVAGADFDIGEGAPLDVDEVLYEATEREGIVEDEAEPARAPPARSKGPQRDPNEAALAALELRVSRAPKGERNNTLNSVAFTVAGMVKAGRIRETEGMAALKRGARACDLDDDEAARTIASGWGAGESKPLESEPRRTGPVYATQHRTPERRPLTDLGNAERLIDRHGDELLYVAGLGWHRWDSRRFERDVDGAIQRCARETARSLLGEAERCSEPEIRKAVAKWALSSESRDKQTSMVALAQHDARVSVRADQLDADPWLLNVANGAIELKTGRLRPHRREDLCTKIADVPYDPAAPCPTWDAFLARVAPDAELREFLRRWAGYSLTAIPREHAIAFLCGPGRNGKGVFLLTLRSILGDYACKAPRGLLTTSKAEKHPTEMMMLRGARMAWCSEIDEGSTWDESKVKDLASEDPITAHYMRHDDVTWAPTHKLWIAGNHKPRVKGTDEGIWSRLRLVPFEVVIPEGERDPHLAERLKDELPGILRWAVEGCLAWQAGGLGAPAAVREATQTYRDDQDVIGRFVADRCWTPTDERDRERATVKASLLYTAFVAWTEGQGERPPSQTRFGDALARRGFVKARTRDGVFYRGIGVIRESADDSRRGAA